MKIEMAVKAMTSDATMSNSIIEKPAAVCARRMIFNVWLACFMETSLISLLCAGRLMIAVYPACGGTHRQTARYVQRGQVRGDALLIAAHPLRQAKGHAARVLQ